jgi:outer membrane protein
MKTLPISALVAALLFLTSTVQAKTLSLNECLERATRNNPVLKTAAWDSRIAEENVRQATSTMYPRIDAQAGYTVQHRPQAVVISGNTAETQQDQYATAGISVYYTLYDFGRRSARRQQARSTAESTENIFKARQKDISLQVIETYFGILEAGKLLNNAEEEVAQIDQHRRIAQIMFEEGVVTRNDVLQADVRLAAARQKQIAIKNRRENAWLQLNYLTGVDQSYRADLNESTSIAPPETGKLDDKTELNSRHEVLALRQNLEAGDAEVKETGNGFMPELFTRLAMEYVENEKAREQAIYSAVIGVKLNVFDGFSTTSTRDRAIKNRSRTLDLLRQTESQIQLEVAALKNDVCVASERISVAETAIRQSEENLRINRERYRERVGTATEVLDAQTLVTQTRTDYYSAIYDHQVSLARLKRALGTL